MSKKMYLISCCNFTDYKKLIKKENGWIRSIRMSDIEYHIKTSPLFVVATKDQAIKDCRKQNNLYYQSDELTFFTEINVYK